MPVDDAVNYAGAVMNPRRIILILAVWALILWAALAPVIEWKKSSGGMTREQLLEQVR
jgi:hypothetical protein